MGQPVLRTARLLMVPLADRHLAHEIELDADPEVLRYLCARPRTSAEVAQSHARRMHFAAQVDQLGFWMAFTGDNAPPRNEEVGRFVGLMMLPPALGPDEPVAELGYRLHRAYWRQGFATEASRALLEHAFTTAAMDKVIAQTMAVNRGSRGVMRAIGMRYVRTVHSQFDEPLPGTEYGEVEYELTRKTWTDHCRPSGLYAEETLPPQL